ncbi:ferredoxin [Candidatus Parcubacteria bacterium]|nr:ferredoxin [Candidatus Parcubacteria bacterium]
MSVSINKDLCIGCGVCVSISPKGFKMGDSGKAEVLLQDNSSASNAATSCPVQAITVN